MWGLLYVWWGQCGIMNSGAAGQLIEEHENQNLRGKSGLWKELGLPATPSLIIASTPKTRNSHHLFPPLLMVLFPAVSTYWNRRVLMISQEQAYSNTSPPSGQTSYLWEVGQFPLCQTKQINVDNRSLYSIIPELRIMIFTHCRHSVSLQKKYAILIPEIRNGKIPEPSWAWSYKLWRFEWECPP